MPVTRDSDAIPMDTANGIVTGVARITSIDSLLAPCGIMDHCRATLPAEKSGPGALLLAILDPGSKVRLREVADA